MSVEIEAKLKVDSAEPVKNKLAELGAEFLAEQLQTDYYFDDPEASLTKTDRCLRLRQELAGDSKKALLTYKGPREKGNFKKREEAEVEVADVDSAKRFILAIGYKGTVVFEKKRLIWRLGECMVSLDELPLLGYFVEIEGPDDEKIADVQRNLGLSDLPHIQESYAYLMERKLNQLGAAKREVFL